MYVITAFSLPIAQNRYKMFHSARKLKSQIANLRELKKHILFIQVMLLTD